MESISAAYHALFTEIDSYRQTAFTRGGYQDFAAAQRFSRFGCAFAPAFGRAVAASRCDLDAGLKPRSTSEATAKSTAKTKNKYRDPSTRALRSLRMTSVGGRTLRDHVDLLEDGDSREVVGDAGFPFGGAGVVDAGAFGVDGYGYGHVFDVELVDGFHAEVFEGEDAAALDGL
jgi:hypothetical protein